MTGSEHQAQKVVADVVVDRGFEIRDRRLGRVQLVAEGVLLAQVQLAAAELVDRPAFGRRHQPGPGVVRHTGLGPALERRDHGILRELLRQTDVLDHACQTSDQPRQLDSKNRSEGVLGV
jgi:hypothetical protein